MYDIRQYEEMAMLDLPCGERELLGKCLDNLTSGLASLESIDTGCIVPLVSVLDLSNVLREDISNKLLTREETLANAPKQSDGYFQVPGTLE